MLPLVLNPSRLRTGGDLHKAATADAGMEALGYLRRMHGMKRTGWMGWVALAVALMGWGEGVGQTDTEFWFVAPEVWAGHGDFPIVLRFSTLGEPATVTVEQPANPAFPTQTLNVAANGVATLDLTPWMGMVENKPVNTVLGFGLYITSTAEITAYYEVNHIDNPDLFTLKGSAALGTDFYTPFQTFLNNNYPTSTAGLDIVATENGTSVTVTPATALIGHPAGVPFTVTLDAGETYALRAASTAAGQHPAGTRITSSAPIAVTMSDDSIVGAPYGGSCFDLLGDQLIPVAVAGTEHIAVKGPGLNGPDKVFILATEDGTTVEVNGLVFATLNAGETYTHTLLADVAYYSTSAPVLVLHLTGVSCEVAGAVLPPLECTGSFEVGFVRSTGDEFALTLLVQAGAEGGFAFNGNPIWIPAGAFAPVAGSGGDWLYAQITATAFIPVLASSRVTNTLGRFHLGTINGLYSAYARYGYFSDFQSFTHETSVNDSDLCPGEFVTLTAEPVVGGTYDWTGPNGFFASGAEHEVGPLTPADAGEYIVTGMAGECPIEADTLVLVVNPGPPAPDLSFPDPWCAESEANLVASGPGDAWSWVGPDGPIPNTGPELTVSEPGTYGVAVAVAGCLSDYAEWTAAFSPAFEVALSDAPVAVCEGSDWAFEAPGLPEGAWSWSHPDGSTTAGAVLGVNGASPDAGGWYVLDGTTGGCAVVADSVLLQVDAPVDLAADVPATACTGDGALALEVDDADGGSWSADCACLSGSSFLPGLAGVGVHALVYVSDGACANTVETEVTVLATPDAGFGSPVVACLGQGEVALLPVEAGGAWWAECGACINAAGVFDTGVAGEGIWSVEYSIAGSCPSSSSGTFEVTPNASSAFTMPATACANGAPLALEAEVGGGDWFASCGDCLTSSGLFTPADAGPGAVSVTYAISGACGSSTTETVTVQGLPDASFEVGTAAGCAPLVVELNANFSGGVACSWQFDGPQGSATSAGTCGAGMHVFTEPGCYSIEHSVTDAFGCTGTSAASAAVCVSAPPSAGFTWSPSLPEWSDALFTLQAEAADVAWTWEFNGVVWGTESTLEVVPTDWAETPWNICLNTLDTAGCEATSCAQIKPGTGLDVWAPNAFTPDFDGRNDAWRLVLGGDVAELELAVFDRWGALVFATNELDHWWDGRVLDGSHFAPNDVYLWHGVVFDALGKRRRVSGHVTLIR